MGESFVVEDVIGIIKLFERFPDVLDDWGG
jgi:hypothetical protein